MKKFANAEIEVVKFNNAVIATSGCTDITKAGNYYAMLNYYNNDPTAQESGVSFEEYLAEVMGSYFNTVDNMIN